MPQVLSASTLMGDKVVNAEGEDLGEVSEVMIDLDAGQIAYVVITFGGFLGLGGKLFAFPWGALTLDPDREVFVVDVDREQLEEAPGFDEDDWPKTGDRGYVMKIYKYYSYEPYW